MYKFVLAALITTLALPGPAVALDDSPLQLLSKAEKRYYDLVFNYVMETIKPNSKYNWESYSGNGMLTVSEVYVSKSGATCRNFVETFAVHGVIGDNEGVGCKRVGTEGWCKLKLDNALTCAMEPSSNPVEETLRDAKEFIQGKEGKANSIQQMLP